MVNAALKVNAAHKFADKLSAKVNIPMLHIGDVISNKIYQDRLKTVGLIGTRVTMESDFYYQSLDKRRINMLLPSKLDQFSTFLGKAGIYLEDLYVKPKARSNGISKKMLSFLARLAIERNCRRLEWWVLDWNEDAIGFYKRLGAEPMDEWTVYRIIGQALDNLAALKEEK